MYTNIRHLWNSYKKTRTVRTGQPNQDNEVRLVSQYLDQDRAAKQHRLVKAGQPEQDSQKKIKNNNRTGPYPLPTEFQTKPNWIET